MKFDLETLEKLRRMIRWFDSTVGRHDGAASSPSPANVFVPFEVVAVSGNPRGKQLYYLEQEYKTSAEVNDVESELFSIDDQSYSVGDRVWAVWRGRWEIVGGAGGGGGRFALAHAVLAYDMENCESGIIDIYDAGTTPRRETAYVPNGYHVDARPAGTPCRVYYQDGAYRFLDFDCPATEGET